MAQVKMTKLNALEMVNGLPRNILDELAKGSQFSGGDLAEKLGAMLETERKVVAKRSSNSNSKTVSHDARKLYDTMVEKGLSTADGWWVLDNLPYVKTIQKATAMFGNLVKHGYAVKSYNAENGHVQYTLTDKVMTDKE